MNTVKLQAYAWISDAMGAADNQNQVVKKQVQEESTLFDLFSDLARNYPDFSQKVFNPKIGQISDQVMIILNGRLIQARDFQSTIMHDKDSLILSPVLAGG